MGFYRGIRTRCLRSAQRWDGGFPKCVPRADKGGCNPGSNFCCRRGGTFGSLPERDPENAEMYPFDVAQRALPPSSSSGSPPTRRNIPFPSPPATFPPPLLISTQEHIVFSRLWSQRHPESIINIQDNQRSNFGYWVRCWHHTGYGKDGFFNFGCSVSLSDPNRLGFSRGPC